MSRSPRSASIWYRTAATFLSDGLTLRESIKLLRKGASVAASVYTLAFPGAEITAGADEDRLVTYEEFPIEGTHLNIRMTDKILPRDTLLRAVLERSEAILQDLDREFFSGEGAFRSMLAPLTFHAIARSLEESGVTVPDEIRTAMREVATVPNGPELP